MNTFEGHTVEKQELIGARKGKPQLSSCPICWLPANGLEWEVNNIIKGYCERCLNVRASAEARTDLGESEDLRKRAQQINRDELQNLEGLVTWIGLRSSPGSRTQKSLASIG